MDLYSVIIISALCMIGGVDVRKASYEIKINQNNDEIGIDIQNVRKFKYLPNIQTTPKYEFNPDNSLADFLYPDVIENSLHSDARNPKQLLGISNNTPGLTTTINVTDTSYWNHEEQSTWADKFPGCGGIRQSPINIITTATQTVTGISCLKWSNYQTSTYLTLQNTGHTIDVSSTFRSGNIPIISGGSLTGSYKVEALHFHWGSDNSMGSEHTIDGETAPLEMHVVHYNSKFSSISEAIASGESEALVVVGVLFRLNALPNPGMFLLMRSMLAARSNGTQTRILPLGNLGLRFTSGYYTYLGSLTTPPCYQIVRWIIPTTTLNVTPRQLRIFRNIRVNNKVLVNNFRRPKPLNNRQVQYVTSCS